MKNNVLLTKETHDILLRLKLEMNARNLDQVVSNLIATYYGFKNYQNTTALINNLTEKLGQIKEILQKIEEKKEGK